MLRKIVSWGIFFLVLAAMGVVVVGGGRHIFGGEPSPGVEISPASLERSLLGMYLLFRQGDIEAPASADSTPVTFTVWPGDTATIIASRLQQTELIKDAELFRLLLRYRQMDTRLEAGVYKLRPNMTMDEIIAALQHGNLEETIVTIPEGWRAEQIAELLLERGLADGDEFLALVQSGGYDYAFLRDRPEGSTPSLEGYLFPDTYRVPLDLDVAYLIDSMLRNFDQRFTPAMKQQATAQGLTIHQVVTLASIVEREAVIASERPIIASVYLNRLAISMKLDADPTVQYALGYQADEGTWWKILFQEDKEIDSPYNTYKYAGLPPGPICNPGLASIQAVLEPAQTDYYFFVATGDGAHDFSETFEEHLEKQKKYQQ